VATGPDFGVGSGGGQDGDGPEDSAEVPARSASAERERTKAYVANTTGPIFRYLERIRQLLIAEPDLQAKTLFEHLQRTYPGRFRYGKVRTMRRRIKHWQATEGPPREVFFAQDHRLGEFCQSDFTHCRELGRTINGCISASNLRLRSNLLELGNEKCLLFRNASSVVRRPGFALMLGYSALHTAAMLARLDPAMNRVKRLGADAGDAADEPVDYREGSPSLVPEERP
jgi:hypothetical protein